MRKVINNLGPMLAVVALALSVGCGNPRETEVVQHVKDYCKLTQLGADVYLCRISPAVKNRGIVASKTIFEFRNSRIVVFPDSLTEADKLNGLEWRGQVRLEVKAVRRYSPQNHFGIAPDKTWANWVAPTTAGDFLVLNVSKTKGEWKVVPITGDCELFPYIQGDGAFKHVEPSDLPR